MAAPQAPPSNSASAPRPSFTLKSRAAMGRKRAAEKKDPTFFTGEDAMHEVAKEDGVWDWALVGPDPEKLPLAAGGHGRVEDMQAVLSNFPILFGLVRLSFAPAEGKTVHKFVYVQ